MHVVERHAGCMVVNLFAESVRQSSESAQVHSHTEILAPYEARRDMVRVCEVIALRSHAVRMAGQ